MCRRARRGPTKNVMRSIKRTGPVICMGWHQVKKEKRDACVEWSQRQHIDARAMLLIIAARMKRYSYSPLAQQALTNTTDVITSAMKASVNRQRESKRKAREHLEKKRKADREARLKELQETRLKRKLMPRPKVTRTREYVYRYRPRNALAKNKAATQAREGSNTTEQSRRP